MKKTESIGLQIPLKQAEDIRRYLLKKELMRTDLEIYKDDEFIYFPIKKPIKELSTFKLTKREFQNKSKTPVYYKEILQIPDHLKAELRTSYDVVGDIILIKLSEKILDYKKEIGEALLKTNKKIKTVCLVKPVTGEFRTRTIEIIAGKNQTKTVHIEYGLKLKLDVEKTYFSPRLATERKRVANQVKSGEIIVDMFTGVAPFPIMIAKYANPEIIYAIDKNKDAIAYAKQNIKINNVLDKIEVIQADSKNIIKILDKKNVRANRIIMNLPFSAFMFFPYALQVITDSCIIHYYDIIKEEQIAERIESLKKIADDNKVSLSKASVHKIKTYAPHEFYIGIDITAKRNSPM